MRFRGVRLPVLVAGLILLAGLVVSPSATAAFKHLQDGMTAPVIRGTDLLTGDKVSSEADSPDEVVVVTFWATWSERSLELLDDLKGMVETYQGHPFRVIAVNVESEVISGTTVEIIRQRVESMELPFPVILDDGLEHFYSFGVIAVPSTAILSNSGVMRYGPAGYSYTVRDRMVDSTEVLLGIKAVTQEFVLADSYQPDLKSSRYYYLALNLSRQGMLERALEHIKSSVAADSNFSAPHRLRGEILLDLGRVSEALESFAKAVRLDESSVSAWAGWGRTLVESGDPDAGREKLEHALELDESYTPALLDLAKYRCRAGEVEEALKTLREARDLNPLDPAILYQLGRCCRTAELNREAVESFKRALELAYPEQ